VVFTPVRLVIDTLGSEYSVRQAGTLRLDYKIGQPQPFIISIFGFRVNPTGKSRTQPGVAIKGAGDQKISRRRRKSPDKWRQLFSGVVRSIRITILRLDLDTGDAILNAQIVPLAMLINRGPVNVTTNYRGQSYLHLEAECHLNRMIWPLIKFFTYK
jgi:hypothetical protein